MNKILQNKKLHHNGVKYKKISRNLLLLFFLTKNIFKIKSIKKV